MDFTDTGIDILMGHVVKAVKSIFLLRNKFKYLEVVGFFLPFTRNELDLSKTIEEQYLKVS